VYKFINDSMNYLSCIYLLVVMTVVIHGETTSCNAIGQCGCELPNGESKVDLSPITKISPVTPAFSQVLSTGSALQYDPCRSFNCESSADARVCETALITSAPVNYGKDVTYSYDDVSKQVTFTYHYTDTSGQSFKTYVKMVCSTNDGIGTLTATDSSNDEQHLFLKLESKYACFIPTSHSNKLSTGTILCILFFVFVFLYIVLGIILNKYVRKLETAEYFPNIVFWREFPSLVKGGTVFTYNKLKGLRKGEDYEKI